MTRKDIKHQAKIKMHMPASNVFVVGLVFFLIRYVLSNISQSILMGPMLRDMQANPEQFYTNILEGLYIQPEVPTVGRLIAIAISIVSIILAYGFRMYCMQISRDRKSGIGTLFDGFSQFIKVIWLHIRIFLVMLLWEFLALIPGVILVLVSFTIVTYILYIAILFIPVIIVGYRYSQAFYLLIDHPDWKVRQCMRESKRLMRGYKKKLFALDLSFLGWYILELFPFVSVYVRPYTGITHAIFYNHLVGWQPEQPDASAQPEKAPWEY